MAVRAPELRGGEWIGTTEPLTLAALRGKIVVLDFWTSSCVNCERLIDRLRDIEARFADEVVVVGVHTPKFPAEHEHAAVVEAVTRLRIAHPVLDDAEGAVWDHYAVKGWPTLVVIDPDGYVVGGASGESAADVVLATIERLAREHADTIRRGRLPSLAPVAAFSVGTGLLYPAGVAVDPEGGRLAIADTGNDRVVVCDVDGTVEFAIASIAAPHGLCFDGQRVIVCETGADRVISIALDGVADTSPAVVANGVASPYDVAVHGERLVVAEAGRHRLRSIAARGTAADTSPGAADVLAGTGEENLVDGTAGAALLAQPSGVAVLGEAVYFVDAESSALRVLVSGDVRTLVGQGLFDWGASDGGPESAALQHPTAITVLGGGIAIADTLNSLLRVWTGTEPIAERGTLRTLPAAGLSEPRGIDVLPDGRLVVADTNNHRVVLVDPASGEATPIVLDERWLGTARGDDLRTWAGGETAVPFALQLGDDVLDLSEGEPVTIDVSAYPPSLLGPGARRWALRDEQGTFPIVGGTAGTGLLVVSVDVAIHGLQHHTTLHATTRHRFTVSAAPVETA